MTEPLTLGVAGLGTVGAGLLQLLDAHGDRLAETISRPIQVVGVSARTRAKSRGVKLDGINWFDDPVALARDPSMSPATVASNSTLRWIALVRPTNLAELESVPEVRRWQVADFGPELIDLLDKVAPLKG